MTSGASSCSTMAAITGGDAERRTDADEPVVGLDANECRVAFYLCSEISAVTLLLGNRRRHGDGGHFGDLHWLDLPCALRWYHAVALARSQSKKFLRAASKAPDRYFAPHNRAIHLA